ncbi:hypothetical protein [Kribbella sp. NPDC023855]|uniref:hypothetical protein n=1 Tax=Kribbella sp. NPDC023855 TaxID=3154698 RepID=UPI0033C832C3
MTSGDLKHLLHDLAADGAERVELDEEQLVPRIRSRRRRRAALTAAVAASTAVMLAAGAYAVLPGGGQEQWPAAGGTPTPARPPVPTMTITPGETRAWDACGASLTAAITGDPSLLVSVTTRKVARSAGAASAPIGVQVSNTTGRTLDLTGTPGGPGLVVVKDGVVVARPLGERSMGRRWVFTPRQTATIVTSLSLRRCDRLGPPVLEPGSYQLYALKTFHQNRRDFALYQVQAAGGPWTVQVT